MIREKNPAADLRKSYKKVFGICTVISFLAHTTIAIMYPTFKADASTKHKKQAVIETVDIPETRQIKRPPPPPRPSVPIATESDDVPDDVTIESSDLDFDQATVDLPPPPPPGQGQEQQQEEILEFYMVEQKPDLIKGAAPVYPEIARKAGLTGKVYLKFKVGKDGRVSDVQVLKGQEIFRQAAIDAIMKFRFKPAKQNDKPVAVWMTQPITFRLN
jgi:protein TonB